MEWSVKPFAELTNLELYGILQARTEVFLMEQKIICQDMDGLDVQAVHVFAKENDRILACLRILPPGSLGKEATLGRILTVRRGCGLGRTLMERGIAAARQWYQSEVVRISAQLQVEGFYQRLGFIRTSLPYDEEGVPHVEMKKSLQKETQV